MGFVNGRTGKLVVTPDQSFVTDFAGDNGNGPDTVKQLQKLGTVVFLEIGQPGMTPLKSAFRSANANDSKRTWTCALENGNNWESVALTAAKLHTSGVAIDWRAFDEKYEFNYLQLPTYPFQRERFWLDATSSGGVGGGVLVDDSVQGLAVTKAISPVINLILGQQISSPFMDDIIFISHCSIISMPVLEDHVINDLCIVPAVFQVGMALEAAVHLAGGRTTQTLQDLVIPAALLLKGAASKSVQLVLKPCDDDNVLEFELNSIGDADETLKGSWQTHASGRMRIDGKTPTGSIHESPDSIKRRCNIEHTLPEFYKFMWEREYALGPMFQLIQHIWRNDREAISKLSRYTDADAITAESTCLYPVYFDCCIQNCMAIVAWDTPLDTFKTYVPLGCGTFNLYKSSMGKDLWCHTDLSKSAGAGRLDEMDVITGDLFLIDSDGDVVAEAINFRVKRAGKELLMNSLKEDLSGWFYNIDWSAAELTEPSGTSPGTAIVLADTVVAPQLVQKLQAAGETVVLVKPGESYSLFGTQITMDPANPSHYTQLLGDAIWSSVPPCTKVLHMWALDSCSADDATASELTEATRIGTHSALFLTQALATWDHKPRLYLVTAGTQPVVADAPGLAVAQAPLFGFGKVAGLEMPQLLPTRVDLDLFDKTAAADQLFSEIAGSDEEEVAFRGGSRFVSRLVQRKKDKGGSVSFDPSGSYMVTGGFGGLGLLVADFLVEHGAKRLVLTSRRGMPSTPPKEIAALESKGAVVVAGKADVADLAALREVFNEAAAAGAPIAGVIHSAGVLDDKKLIDMDLASFEKVMGSKVTGGRNLHELTRGMSTVDTFILFSSATSAIGNVGQSNYAAANGYLDALAHHRSLNKLPGLSVNWGPWGEVGMAADPTLKGILGSIGVELIPPDLGIQALETAIASASPQFVTVRIGWSKYLAQYAGGNAPAIFKTVAAGAKPDAGAKKKKKSAAAGAQELIGKLTPVPAAKRPPVLQTMLQAKAMEVLGVTDASAVSTTQPLSELGLDSMLAVELRNELTEMVGANLSATLLFDFPTIEAISFHLLDDILCLSEESGDSGGGAGGAMSQEQLDKLRGDPIAICGMSCRMPAGGNSPTEFWDALKDGAILTAKVPKERWDHDFFYDIDQEVPGKTFTDQGGFVTCDVAMFDAQFFGIAKREAEFMDPAQRMVMEVTWEALEIAGMAPDSVLNTRTGCYTGLCACDYQLLETKSGNLEPMTGLYGTGNSHAVAAGRLAYTLGAKGPAFSVDTACSSALIAAHLACMDLRNGITNMGLGGGVHLLLAPDLYINFAKAHMLSPNGRCATFDAAADGFCRAEGSCMVVLKRVAEAEAAGDPVVCLVHGSATNQDGRSNSLTAPNGPSQQMAIGDSLQMGSIEPSLYSYLECHGTGTSLGDPIEVQAAGNVLGQGRGAESPLVLGSIKAALGHLEAAAGISGLCKILMCMANETIPLQPHYKTLNPMITIDTVPAVIPTEQTPWKGFGNRFVSGVSSFGFGGSNAHATVEKYHAKPMERTQHDRSVSLMTLSATSTRALKDLSEKFVAAFNVTDESLPDYCYSAATGRNHFAYRLSVICHTATELKDGLTAHISDSPTSCTVTGRTLGNTGVVMMFTGEGSQYAGMGADLYDTQPVFRDAIDSCAKTFAAYLDKDLVSVLYPKSGESTPLNEPAYAKPALFAFEYALANLWMAWGVEPAAVMGRDVGECVAACLAGVFSLEDGCKLVASQAAGSSSEFEKAAKSISYSDPYTTFILAENGTVTKTAPGADYFIAHLRNPAPLKASVDTAAGLGFQLFLEVGPDLMLVDQAQKSDPELQWLPSLKSRSPVWETITATMAHLYVAGVPIKFDKYEQEFARQKVIMPTYAFQRMRYWHDNCELLNGNGDWTLNAGAGGVPLSNLLYSVDWEKQQQTSEGNITKVANWLILCDGQGYGDAIAQKISSSGGASVSKLYADSATPLSDDSFIKLVKGTTGSFQGPAVIIDLWNLDAAPVEGLTPSALEQATLFGSGHAMLLAKAVASTTHKVWFVTKGGQPVVPGSPVEVAQGPVWGMARTIALEYPDNWGGLIDLCPKGDMTTQCARLLNEVLSTEYAGAEDHIAFRADDRFVLRINPDQSSPAASPLALNADASYVITGGFGGVLKEVAKWMVANGAKHLVLTTRRKNADPAFLEELLSLGAATATEANVDVCDTHDITTLLTTLNAGPHKVAGIVHGAGALTTSLIDNLPLGDLQKVLKPKTVGSWNLHTATETMDLDFLVLFSSISAAWGSNQLAHYGAANHFLDVLSHHRASLGKVATSIQWGLLEGGGMSSHDNVAQSTALGLRALTVAEITSVMGHLAAVGATQNVAVGINWKKFKSIFESRGAKPLLSAVGQVSGGGDSHGAGPDKGDSAMLKEILAVDEAGRRAKLLAIISAIASEILGFDDELDVHRGLFELGFDSLSAIDFKSTMEAELGCNLPSTLAFDYPSVDAITGYIHDDVLPGLAAGAANASAGGSVSGGGYATLGVIGISQEGVAGSEEDWTVTTDGVLVPAASSVLQSVLVERVEKQTLRKEMSKFADGQQAQLQLTPRAASAKPKVGMMFTGQGSQFVGMGETLYESETVFKRAIDQCDAVLLDPEMLGCSLVRDVLLYGNPSGPKIIDETKYTQPALFAFEYALAQLWISWGVEPAAVMGHSVGEYVAACVAGVFTLEDGLRLVTMRASLMGDVKAGGVMFAIMGAKGETNLKTKVAPIVAKYSTTVSIAAANGPGLVVVSGEPSGVDQVVSTMKSQGCRASELAVSDAFHSPLMQPMLDMFGMMTEMTTYQEPKIPLVSCVTGALAAPGLLTRGSYWKEHVPACVDFFGGVTALTQQAQCTVLLEVGPHTVLTGMAKRCFLDKSQHDRLTFVGSLDKSGDNLKDIRNAAASLYAAGGTVSLAAAGTK